MYRYLRITQIYGKTYSASNSYQIGKNKFHKSQLFDYRNEVSSFVGEDKCGIGKLLIWIYFPENVICSILV